MAALYVHRKWSISASPDGKTIVKLRCPRDHCYKQSFATFHTSCLALFCKSCYPRRSIAVTLLPVKQLIFWRLTAYLIILVANKRFVDLDLTLSLKQFCKLTNPFFLYKNLLGSLLTIIVHQIILENLVQTT